ncbi:MAG: hypothetical protein QOG87_4305 [Actinomycetota bacterium]|jgi:hypothetical protein
MNEWPDVRDPDPDPALATPLRLVAAERLDRMQREAALDLRGDHSPAGDAPGTVVTSSNRVEALHGAVVSMAARVQELATQTATFSELLTGRHLDYSDQVRRLSMVAEQSLAEHRLAIADRDAAVERMADAVGSISTDLGGILEQVMAALRQSREVTARNEVLSEQLASGFARASQQLADQGQELRDELARATATRMAPGSIAGVEDLRSDMQSTIDQLREDIGTDLAGLRRLLSRNRTEAPAPSEELDALRVDITSEMEALVRELHDDQVLMMREILASQKELKKLRDDVAAGNLASSARSDGGSGTPAQLENEMSRLLIELRALRRRPFLDPRATDTERAPAMPAPAKRPAPRPRARLSPSARSQWAGRPMKGSNGSAR